MDPERFHCSPSNISLRHRVCGSPTPITGAAWWWWSTTGALLSTDGVLDLSYGAAKAIDMVQKGVAPVQIEVIQVDQSRLAHPLESPARLVSATSRPPKSSPMRSSGKDIVRSRSLDSGRAVGFYYRVWVGEFVYRGGCRGSSS